MKNKSCYILALLGTVLALGSAGSANANLRVTTVEQSGASIDRNAVLADSAVCTVVLKTSIEASQALGTGNPIDSLMTMPATCTGNMLTHTQMPGGVRQMLVSGFRLIGVSHQVTTLVTTPTGKAELLISAMFALERPTSVILNTTR